jgi:beta-lactamase superfamily II metal-dependent hydrolase
MPFDPQFDDYLKTDTARAYFDETGGGGDDGFFLLWGDGVKILVPNSASGLRSRISARGKTGWIDKTALGGKSLLEYYFIDVGQGDGVLIKTPDFRHILIDAGYPRSAQPTGKSGADFVDWKFAKDYGTDTIRLDAMISSHIDWDHHGGLNDILDVAQISELDCQQITVEAFYHSGLSHWKAFGGVPEGLGPFTPKTPASAKKWFTRLLDDRISCDAAVNGQGPQVRGTWGKLIKNVVSAKRADGAPTVIVRMSHNVGWLPGFPANGQLGVKVLGPVEEIAAGAPALRRLGSEQGQNTNGTSVLLRFDYGKSRTLLTGDLNKRAHQMLLEHYDGSEGEFACDVAKSCHHGSDDVSYAFMNHVKAACTVISSGDAEGHDHPRPKIVAASGLSGYATFKDDELVTPLVYSTELARSITVGPAEFLDATGVGGALTQGAALSDIKIGYKFTPPGALNPSKGTKTLDKARVMHKLIYGLVNVRTNGTRILAATMNEGDGSFSVKSFNSRF